MKRNDELEQLYDKGKVLQIVLILVPREKLLQ